MNTSRSGRVYADVLSALAQAGVKADVRKDPNDRELDLAVDPRQRDELDAVLRRIGFIRFHARGQRGHRFYLTCVDGTWLKVDVKPTGPAPGATFAAASSLVPLGLRRAGPVIAFIGPDGAGKGTLIDAVRETLPVAVTVRYLGTRPRATGTRPTDAVRRSLPLGVREPLFVLKKLGRASLTLASVYASAWRGTVVLCDRHPLEALATRPRRTRSAAALERLLLVRVMPKPDLIVILDAPTDVLLARKAEHSGEVLDAWRAGYSAAFDGWARARTCRTDAPLPDVADEVRGLIWEATLSRRRC